VKRKTLRFGRGFRVAVGNGRCQAAEMVIRPGDSEGGRGNRHCGADQCLFVLSGVGVAKVNGKRYALRKGVVMLIERGDEHEISNTGHAHLRTLNFYNPPAYSSNGDELPSAQPG
jgi:mannose-6-phosphate isomerase-like protein (cupin superfamily)